VSDANRRYERIEIELPVRLFIPGQRGLRFEAYCTSRNLGLGGLFVGSTFLLKHGTELSVELGLPDGRLPVKSRVAHVVPSDDEALATGMGIEFLDVDARGREALLRYFTPLRYQEFYREFAAEFPHLEEAQPLRDVSLVLNLWEEWKVRQEGGPASTASGAPPAPPRRPGELPFHPPARPAPRPAPRRPRGR
jgi:Tfp pilus assembly protein PilZ